MNAPRCWKFKKILYRGTQIAYPGKSFCVPQFGKVAVTSTGVENSFFRAIAVFKLITGLHHHTVFVTYFEEKLISEKRGRSMGV
jgi:hypothetical protein